MRGNGDDKCAPSSTIKGHRQQLTFTRHHIRRPLLPLSAHVLKVADAFVAAAGGHQTFQRPFPAITSIVITGSPKSLSKQRTLVSQYPTTDIETIQIPPP
jgi:hypothetical protein